MADFIVNEANFVIDMDDGIKDDWLVPGQHLPNGSCIEVQIDRADNFQLYEVTDGAVQILAVSQALKERWCTEGYLPPSAFMTVEGTLGPVEVLVSPANLVLGRITELRAYGSLRYALNVAAALENARRLNPQVTLRDGIYCELYATVLPTFSKTREVCDRALFLNVLSPDRSEDLSTRADMSPSELNPYVVKADLQARGFALGKLEPFFMSGEVVQAQGFDSSLTIAGCVCMGEHYQVYACSGEDYLLLLEPEFAASLCKRGLLAVHELLNVRVDFGVWRALILSKRYALERLDDRHFGLTDSTAVALALAMARTRAAMAEVSLYHGLYCAQLGVILSDVPQSDEGDDAALYLQILAQGPFAHAPFDTLQLNLLPRLLA
ncbi:MAG: hypothetical protein IAA31_04995 [Candidatus Anaerobiospirillum merdipullorum]|uniref:Uncharacterized protein n=1 Tax=Candidatus Anaerobiospirillum merdipullorum TaxID=2838450 RepID=A0A9E2KPT5_9GAMM|nr:hypothetical protein [Candidatus Anaerobiospirillum merdipullorum]